MAGEMKPAKVVFDDFSGEDYGRDWSGMDAEDKFRAINIVRYPGGWIGPRSPMIRFHIPAGVTPDGEDPDIIGDLDTEPRAIWFLDNQIALTSDGYAWNIQTGQRSVDAVPNIELVPDYFVTTFGFLWCNTMDASAQADFIVRAHNTNSGPTVPVIDYFADPEPMSGSLRAERYNDTIVYTAYRTFDWSDGLIFDATDDWPPANTSDIFTRAIYDFIEQKNTGVFVTGSFAATSDLDNPAFTAGKFRPLADVYVVYGALGADATLRKVDSGPEPIHTDTGAYIWTASGDDVYWVGYNSLIRFDGAEVMALTAPLPRIHPDPRFDYGPDANIYFWTSAPVVNQGSQILAGAFGPTDPELIEIDGDMVPDPVRKAVFMWSNEKGGQKWTAHDPGITYYADEPAWDDLDQDRFGAGLAKRANSNFYVYNWISGIMVFATGGSTSEDFPEAPKFYLLDTTPDFPDNRIIDGDTTEAVRADFRTADYWDKQGREISVEGVWIDYAYRKWNASTDATENTITVEVESLQLYNDNRPRGGGTVTFNPISELNAGVSSEEGTETIRGRVYIPARSDGSGDGFRIHISDWKGLSIRRITADVRFEEPR